MERRNSSAGASSSQDPGAELAYPAHRWGGCPYISITSSCPHSACTSSQSLKIAGDASVACPDSLCKQTGPVCHWMGKATAGQATAGQTPLAAWHTSPLCCRVMLPGSHLLLHSGLCCQRSSPCLLFPCRAAFDGNVPLLIRLLKGCSADEQQQLDSQGNTVSCWPRHLWTVPCTSAPQHPPALHSMMHTRASLQFDQHTV